MILSPKDGYKTGYDGKPPAVVRCGKILANRGSSPRIYKNMLAFLAPDSDGMIFLKQIAAGIHLEATAEKKTQDGEINKISKNVLIRIWLFKKMVIKNLDTFLKNPFIMGLGKSILVAKLVSWVKRMGSKGTLHSMGGEGSMSIL